LLRKTQMDQPEPDHPGGRTGRHQRCASEGTHPPLPRSGSFASAALWAVVATWRPTCC